MSFSFHRSAGLTRRAVRSASARCYGRVLGWDAAYVPFGSRVIGQEFITVGAGFEAFGPVWIEAIEEFAGDRFTPSIQIGARFAASRNLHISAAYEISIGNDCLFGSQVFVGDNVHGSFRRPGLQFGPATPPQQRPLTGESVTIGDRVWLGDNVVVLPGATIGNGAVVGANSVVSGDVPAETVVAGAPVRVIRQWDDAHGEWRRVTESLE